MPFGLFFYALTVGGTALCLLYAARREDPPGPRQVAGLFAGLGLLGCLGISSPALLVAGTGTVAAVAVARRSFGVAAGRCLSVGSVLIAAGVAADAAAFVAFRYVPFTRWVAAARERYPPVPRAELLPQPAPDPFPRRTASIGSEIYGEAFATPYLPNYAVDHRRPRGLALLHTAHTDFATRFALRPEFGPIRMMGMRHGLDPFDLAAPADPPLPQPAEGWMEPDDALADLIDPDRTDGGTAGVLLDDWHAGRGVDFAHAAGFGLLGSPGGSSFDGATLPDGLDAGAAPYLVGFEPHAAQTPPGEPLGPGWALRRVELIGLVSGPDPVAYASEELPRMGETATHRTRSLTAFERAALPRLAAGEWVVAAGDGARLRAVGALPAAAACAACHGVKTGHLLGALSYDFARSAAGP